VLNPEGGALRLDLGGNLKRAAAFERTYDLSVGETNLGGKIPKTDPG
jgi:hypothetical protein